MTRAKRAMYLVTKPPGTSTSRNFPKLLAETLGDETVTVRVGAREFAGAYAEGDAGWHLKLTSVAHSSDESSRGSQALVAIDPAAVRSVLRLPARLPSAAKAAELSGAQLFSAERTENAGFGIAVHALLAEIEWADPAHVRSVRQQWQQRGVAPEAIAEAAACLAAPELSPVWQRVDGGEVWRERPFEVVLDGTWITGVFDRVVVERDAGGRAVRAIVFDFKTDRTSGDLEPLLRRHAAQLTLYRRVAAVLSGLPERAVDGQLVFTRLRRMMRAPAG
jgi:ATP-dependent helicase/nuclease subunit A